MLTSDKVVGWVKKDHNNDVVLLEWSLIEKLSVKGKRHHITTANEDLKFE